MWLRGGEFEKVFGYSRAVRVGEHIHVAGTCAQPPHDTGDAYTQAKAALGIISAALEKVGGRMEDVVRTVVYITGTEYAEGVTKAHGEVFGQIRPASTCVVVAALLKESPSC